RNSLIADYICSILDDTLKVNYFYRLTLAFDASSDSINSYAPLTEELFNSFYTLPLGLDYLREAAITEKMRISQQLAKIASIGHERAIRVILNTFNKVLESNQNTFVEEDSWYACLANSNDLVALQFVEFANDRKVLIQVLSYRDAKYLKELCTSTHNTLSLKYVKKYLQGNSVGEELLRKYCP
ncbi:hypothetical protein ROZALSC1DRAFT_31751, partial [Rozella allomycis CSF55]